MELTRQNYGKKSSTRNAGDKVITFVSQRYEPLDRHHRHTGTFSFSMLEEGWQAVVGEHHYSTDRRAVGMAIRQHLLATKVGLPGSVYF